MGVAGRCVLGNGPCDGDGVYPFLLCSLSWAWRVFRLLVRASVGVYSDAHRMELRALQRIWPYTIQQRPF